MRPIRLRRRRGWILAAAGIVIIGLAVEGWRLTHEPAVVHYVTAGVTRGTVARAVTASGSVNPVITVQVGSYVSGVITQLSCDFNTQVKKGQLCAKIDPRPYQTIVDQDEAALATSKAQVAKDQTNLDYANVSYTRTQDLFAKNIVSKDQLDAAKSTADQAKAQVDLDRSTVTQHEAELSAAQVNVGYTNIESPVDGTVVSRNVTMGQTVASSFQTPTLFLIATDLRKMQVDANVSETDIGGVAANNPASFTVEAFPDHTFNGSVQQVRQAPQAVQNVVTYDVVVTAPNPDLLLKPGMTATVRIVDEEKDNVIRVPDAALRYVPGGIAGNHAATPTTSAEAQHDVWVLRGDTPASVTITTGLDDDANSEVVSGALQPGDRVIVSEQAGKGAAASGRPPRFFRP